MARISRLGLESETLAKQALMIVVCAREALHTEDLTYALSVEPDSEALEHDNIPDIEDVAGICAGLIVIDKESNIVKLVHKSAQEYFERNQSRWFPKASETIARLCLNYKSLTTLTPGFNKDIKTTWPPFWRYADLNWAYHSHCAEQDDGVSQVRNGNVNENQRLSNLQSISNIAISLLATDMSGSLTSALLNACREGRHALVELLITVNDYDLGQPTWSSPKAYQCEPDASNLEKSFAFERDACSEDGTEGENKYDGSETPYWLGDVDRYEDESDIKSAQNYNHGSDAQLRNIWSEFDSDMDRESAWFLRFEDSKERLPLLEEEHLAVEECPLVASAANGDHDMVKILVNHGADPNVVGTLGQTPLYIAARYGKETVVSLLLELPTVNPNCECTEVARSNTRHQRKTQRVCWTPLLVAAHFCREKCVRLLLDHAQRNYRDGLGRNAACLAAEAGHAELLEELLQWSDVELDPRPGFTGLSPLNIALENKNERAALILIPYSDINCRYPTGDRPLNVAAKASSLKAIQKIFTQGDVDVNAKGFRGQTVLHNAATTGDDEIVALLLAHPSIDINIHDDDGNTPFIRLVKSMRWKIQNQSDAFTSFLSKPELDINAQNLNGNTALLAAPSFRRNMNRRADNVLSTLLFYPGVNKEHRNSMGQTVLTRNILEGSEIIQTIVRETQLSHQFRDIDDDGETLLSLAATHHWSDSDWRFIVDLSPPEFMHRQNRRGETPEQIRSARHRKLEPSESNAHTPKQLSPLFYKARPGN